MLEDGLVVISDVEGEFAWRILRSLWRLRDAGNADR